MQAHLFLKKLDFYSGTGQLLCTQVHALRAANVDAILACERGDRALDSALARHVDVLQSAVGEALAPDERAALHALLSKLRQSL